MSSYFDICYEKGCPICKGDYASSKSNFKGEWELTQDDSGVYKKKAMAWGAASLVFWPAAIGAVKNINAVGNSEKIIKCKHCGFYLSSASNDYEISTDISQAQDIWKRMKCEWCPVCGSKSWSKNESNVCYCDECGFGLGLEDRKHYTKKLIDYRNNIFSYIKNKECAYCGWQEKKYKITRNENRSTYTCECGHCHKSDTYELEDRVSSETVDSIKKMSEEVTEKKKKAKEARLCAEKFFSVIQTTANKILSSPYCSYNQILQELNSDIEMLDKIWRNVTPAVYEVNRKELNILYHFSEFLLKMNEKVHYVPKSFMIDPFTYGKRIDDYWERIQEIGKVKEDKIKWVEETFQRLNSISSLEEIMEFFSNLDIQLVIDMIWMFAIIPPYFAEQFQKMEKLFHIFYRKDHSEIFIAKYYVVFQIGGEKALSEYIDSLLKHCINSNELFPTIASGLMWIGAYKSEQRILQNILSTGNNMSEKMQSRLHSLASNGGKVPELLEVNKENEKIVFFLSSTVWNKEDIDGFFDNLAFQEKNLEYSLAVRDEDCSLTVELGKFIIDNQAILIKLQRIMNDEFEDDACVRFGECIALAEGGQDHLIGFLLQAKECPQMGLLANVIKIGKKINIKFYTLLMPNGISAESQYNQMISMKNKLNPSIVLWENSLKETFLGAIQQILNISDFENIALPKENYKEGIFF